MSNVRAVAAPVYPAISEPVPANIQQVAKELKEAVEILTGRRGRAEDSVPGAFFEMKKQVATASATLTARVSELNQVVVTETEALAQRITTVEASYATADNALSARITDEQTARASADGVLAQRTSVVEAEIRNARAGQASLSARLTQIDTALANGDSALSQRITNLDAAYKAADTTLNASITQVDQARVSGDTALASRATALEAEVTNARSGAASLAARLTTLNQARIDGDNALSSSLSTLQAEVTNARNGQGTLSAYLSVLNQARIDGDNSLSSSLSSLQTTVNGNTANISQLISSTDGLKLKYGLVGSINGVTGGFVLTGVGKNDGTATYNLEINSNVTINGNLIVSGTVTNTQLAANAVSRSVFNKNTTVSSVPIQAKVSLTVRAGANVLLIGTFDDFYQLSGILPTYNISVGRTGVGHLKSSTIATAYNTTSGGTTTYYNNSVCIFVEENVPAGTHEYYVEIPFSAANGCSIMAVELSR